ARAAVPQPVAAGMPDLSQLSIGALAKIDITSVIKSPEPLSNAPAAIYVITHDEIMRSGARTIPEILRLAPNLDVARISANTYAISARGFNGGLADKLLVLIDGRSVYSPLFGGVYWDVQDIPPDDIERIEVISGRGATLWGANAVNGVINIITRNSRDTEGGELVMGGGNLGGGATVQYGGRLAPDLTYRAYLGDFYTAHSTTSTGASAEDGWTKPQGGFRLDWDPGADAVTFQGDLYRGWENAPAAPNLDISGGDLLGKWRHRFANGSALQVLTYYDNTTRAAAAASGGGWVFDAYDLEVQHSFHLNSSNAIVWGVGDRVERYATSNTPSLGFLPARDTLNLADIFAQDGIALSPRLQLTLGMKFEDDPYSGLAPLPSASLAWKVRDNVLLWGAVSRAVRAPTLFDTGLLESEYGIPILAGNPDFRSEKLIAYQLGTRIEITPDASFSLSTYYNPHFPDRHWISRLRVPTLLLESMR
ncbi:MAG: TonB-dependent receptor plug domain-containing protein, partial [Stellaceae bacterium]